MLDLSLMDVRDVVGKPPRALAIPPNFGAWQQALLPSERALRNGRVVAELPQSIWNSAVVSLGTTLLTLPLGGLAGYGLARFAHLRFMRGLLFLFMLTRMLPGLALMIPFFVAYRAVGLLDTKLGLMVAYLSFLLPLATWIMTNYFRALPRTLEWAATVDGANWWQTLWRVLLPVARPGLMATGIFCFIAAWNEFLIARILSSTLASRTVPVTLSALGGGPVGFASGALAVLPPILIAFALQRYLVKGLLSGAAKG